MKRTVTITGRLCFFVSILLIIPFFSIAQPGNNNCATPFTLTSAVNCTGGRINDALRTASGATGSGVGALTTTGCTVTATNPIDVWYTYTATSTNPTVYLRNMGSQMDNAPRIQFYNTNSCTPATLNANQNGCAGGTNVTELALTPTTALTIGQPYRIRVFTDNNSVAGGTATDWEYDICIANPPANDFCAGSISVTSICPGTTSGTLYASTLSSGGSGAPHIVTSTAPNCAPGATRDVWYTYRAQSTNPTISLTGVGSDIREAGIQLLTRQSSSSCTNTSGSSALYCATTTAGSPTAAIINANHLAVGTTYFLRVYSTAATAPPDPTNAGFSLCITNPVAAPRPFNDTCTGAINLAISGNCENYPGTIAGSTLLATPPISSNCAPTATYDVWYKFKAISTSSEVNVTNVATNFTGAGFQVLSGNCGSLTSLATCGTPGTPLTVATNRGQTYYIRVYSTTAGVAPTNDGIFNICVKGANAPLVRFGNSYVNISKKTNGGVVQPGDTLEIRMTINHKNLGGILYQPRFLDSLPTETEMLATTNDSIRIITNEGLTYKKYSVPATGDAALYTASPAVGQYHVRLNVGLGRLVEPGVPTNTGTAAATATGTIDPEPNPVPASNRHNPRGGGGVLFAIAYRVRVTGIIGDTIVLHGGKFIYSPTSGGADTVLSGAPFKILITNPQTLCANSAGLNNAVENGGTFGSGTTLARTTDLTTPIVGYSYVPNPSASLEIGDGRYSIVKNTSPRNSVNRSAWQQPNCNATNPWEHVDNCNNRMFNHWIIDGDHTGTNTSTGNTPPAAATPAGYMLLVNADFVASEAYRQQLTNLCPNTYYEFSAWIRNVCSTCGADSLGNQFTSSGDPARHAGVVGVYPNMSFAVDGIDRYSTGEVDATGWKKRGFVFRTDSTQTSATFTIRNNSQGGGGNDWAMDDISVSTCLPTMSYSPRGIDSLCMNNLYIIGDTIRSVYNTYTNYRWQRKRSYESTWTDLTGNLVATPDTVNGQYQFVTNWTLPPSETQITNNGDLYRVVVATTSSNLSNDACKVSDSAGIYNLRIMNCYDVLSVKLTSFTGNIKQGLSALSWTTSKETEPVSFDIEKSTDGVFYKKIGSVNGYNNPSLNTNRYSFSDTSLVAKKVFYRVILTTASGKKIQSHTVMLQNNNEEFVVANLVNPFSQTLSFDVTTTSAAKLHVSLLDGLGHVVKKQSYPVASGINNLLLNDVSGLSSGIYILQVQQNGKMISKRVIKQ